MWTFRPLPNVHQLRHPGQRHCAQRPHPEPKRRQRPLSQEPGQPPCPRDGTPHTNLKATDRHPLFVGLLATVDPDGGPELRPDSQGPPPDRTDAESAISRSWNPGQPAATPPPHDHTWDSQVLYPDLIAASRRPCAWDGKRRLLRPQSGRRPTRLDRLAPPRSWRGWALPGEIQGPRQEARIWSACMS